MFSNQNNSVSVTSQDYGFEKVFFISFALENVTLYAELTKGFWNLQPKLSDSSDAIFFFLQDVIHTGKLPDCVPENIKSFFQLYDIELNHEFLIDLANKYYDVFHSCSNTNNEFNTNPLLAI